MVRQTKQTYRIKSNHGGKEKMNEVKKIWYAVTNEKEESYDWGYGSENYDKAVEMLKKQGEGEIITIEERYKNGKMVDNCATRRTEYDEIF